MGHRAFYSRAPGPQRVQWDFLPVKQVLVGSVRLFAQVLNVII